MRCPQCEILGYPDRAGRNLLPLDWECQSCGALNDARFNFCLSCGKGLATRCVHCEQPVYTAVCDHCGTAQSRVTHLEAAETQRQAWVPELRQRIQQHRLREDVAAHQVHDPTYGVTEWRAIDAKWKQAAQDRRQRFARPAKTTRARRWQWGRIWGWLWLIFGIGMLLAYNGEWVRTTLSAGWVQIAGWYSTTVYPAAANAGTTIGNWWQPFVSSLSEPINKQESWYAYLFATGIFGLAVMPALIYLWGRLVKRLFP